MSCCQSAWGLRLELRRGRGRRLCRDRDPQQGRGRRPGPGSGGKAPWGQDSARVTSSCWRRAISPEPPAPRPRPGSLQGLLEAVSPQEAGLSGHLPAGHCRAPISKAARLIHTGQDVRPQGST